MLLFAVPWPGAQWAVLMREERAVQLLVERVASPLGALVLVLDAGRLCALDYPEYEGRMCSLLLRRFGPIELLPGAAPAALQAALAAYFAGEHDAIDAISVSMGGSPFQLRVWQALRAIPAGVSWSYGQLAAALGQPSAARAVGLANSLNPIAIVVPCHRLVGADGALTGYAGGLERKRWLLRHEGAIASIGKRDNR
jgi:methylated-DNA-[protein]-cysteine S-methyltransferase